jgi:hypothetical protein
LGHWGTTSGLNFIYVHLNRLIKDNDLDMIYVIGPGHGGPGIVAHTYLEGTYSELYPRIERSRAGLQRLFRQFSWPYGIPSHVAPEVPGSINEGGELGYSLLHAYGAAFDNPDLVVACIVGDGEAETGAPRRKLAFQQISESRTRWRGVADSPLERLQNRQSNDTGAHQRRRAGRTFPWLRLPAPVRNRRRSCVSSPSACGSA